LVLELPPVSMRGAYRGGEEVDIGEENQQKEHRKIGWQNPSYLTGELAPEVARNWRVWRHSGVEMKSGWKFWADAHAEAIRS
jgi:hypothetical protein